MKTYKTGDKIDITIVLDEAIPNTNKLAACVTELCGKKPYLFTEGNGITKDTLSNVTYHLTINPNVTSTFRPSEYKIELMIYTQDKTYINISVNEANFIIKESVGGKEILK